MKIVTAFQSAIFLIASISCMRLFWETGVPWWQTGMFYVFTVVCTMTFMYLFAKLLAQEILDIYGKKAMEKRKDFFNL
jgi:hypothetical protein